MLLVVHQVRFGFPVESSILVWVPNIVEFSDPNLLDLLKRAVMLLIKFNVLAWVLCAVTTLKNEVEADVLFIVPDA